MVKLKSIYLIIIFIISIFIYSQTEISQNSNQVKNQKFNTNKNASNKIHFTLFGNLPSIDDFFIKPLMELGDSIAVQIKAVDSSKIFSIPIVKGENEEINSTVQAHIYKKLLDNNINFTISEEERKKLMQTYNDMLKKDIILKKNGFSRDQMNELKNTIDKSFAKIAPDYSIKITYEFDRITNLYSFTASFVPVAKLSNARNENISVNISDVKKLNVYSPSFIERQSSKYMKLRIFIFTLIGIFILLTMYAIYFFLKHQNIDREVLNYVDEINLLMSERKYVASVLKIQQALYFHPNSPELNEIKSRIKLFIGDKFSKEAAENAERVLLISRKVEKTISENNLEEARCLQLELEKYKAIPEAKDNIEKLNNLKKNIKELEDFKGKGERENIINEIFTYIKIALNENRITDAAVKFLKQEELIKECYEYEEIKSRLKLAIGAIDDSINERNASVSDEINEMKNRFIEAKKTNDLTEIERIFEILRQYKETNRHASKLYLEIEIYLKPEIEKRKREEKQNAENKRNEKLKYLESMFDKEEIVNLVTLMKKYESELCLLENYIELKKKVKDLIGDRNGRITEESAMIFEEIKEIEKMLDDEKTTMNADNMEKMLNVAKRHIAENKNAEKLVKRIEAKLKNYQDMNQNRIKELIGMRNFNQVQQFLPEIDERSKHYIISGDNKYRIYIKIGREALIGRESSNNTELDFIVPSEYHSVSRRHGTFYIKSGKLYYRDEKSSVGSFIGTSRITEVCLEDGEVISLGKKYNLIVSLNYTVKNTENEATIASDEQKHISSVLFEGEKESYLLLFRECSISKSIQKLLDVSQIAKITLSTDGERLYIINDKTDELTFNGITLPYNNGWYIENETNILKSKLETLQISRRKDE